MLQQLSIDELKMSAELDRSRHFDYAEQYAEFQSGSRPWKTCMLWSVGGEVRDGVIARYDTSKPCQPTAYGEQLPYLRQIVEQQFAVEHLLFSRMVLMTDTVLVPHRDFVEYTESRRRRPRPTGYTFPLATSDDCLFMEDNIIYRMLFGKVWSLDVTRMHSAAVLWDTRRVHLILDFADVSDVQLLKFGFDPAVGIHESNRVQRPPLSDRERDAILALSGAIDCSDW